MAPFTVNLVHDDERVLRSLQRLVRSEGLLTQSFTSATVFLKAYDAVAPGCLVLNLRMSDMHGLDVQLEIQRRESTIPIIFIAGDCTVAECATALKAGALDVLANPVKRIQLLDALARAAARDNELRERARKVTLLATLSIRERQVISAVVEGLLNKQTANRLGIVEKTVKVHRAHAMAKLGVRSVADLVRMTLSVSNEAGMALRGAD
jgi:FixJ family two-component response regulator